MAQKAIRLSGKAKWARLVDLDEKYGHWSIVLYPDDESKKVYDKSGLRLKVKSDEDGEHFTLRRSPEVKFSDETKQLEHPTVVAADGRVMDDDEARSVGNGSTVVCTVEVYDTKKFGVGHRLSAVRVVDHVVYTPSTEGVIY